MRSIMKHPNEKRTPTPEKRLSISPILTYYHYYNNKDDDIKNDKEDLIKTKRYLKRQMPILNTRNDIEFEYY